MKKAILFILMMLVAQTSFAQLGVTNKWRIEQAKNHCDIVGNELVYTEYWGKAATPEKAESLCLAEQVAILIESEGDAWLDQKGLAYIEECKTKSEKSRPKYYTCLKRGVKHMTGVLSSPCKEIGAANLWPEEKCQRLVSYIFAKKFESLVNKSRPLKERFIASLDNFMDKGLFKVLFHPVVAVLFFMIFMFDIVFWIEPGNWVRVARMGFMVGPVILFACFVEGGLRYLSSGMAVLALMVVIILNHREDILKVLKKKKE